MTEYTDSPDAIAAWRAQLARTGLWIEQHRALAFAPPSNPPSPTSTAMGGELAADDASRYSSTSLPPKMLLRYNDGRGDVPIEEYAPSRSRRHAEDGPRHLPTLNTHPAPENIQIRPSRSNSSGGPTPVSARPPASRTSSHSTPIHSSPLTGDHIPPYPQQIAVWKTPAPSPSSAHGHGHSHSDYYGAPPMAHAHTHPPTHYPAHDPRGGVSPAPLPVPYRGGQLSPRSRPPTSPPSQQPSHVSSARPSYRSRHDSLHEPGSSRHEHGGSSRHDSFREPGSSRHDSFREPGSSRHDHGGSRHDSLREHAPTPGSSRRGPPVVYSSRAVSRSGSQPPPMVYAPRAHGAPLDERYDPPPLSHDRDRAHRHDREHRHEHSPRDERGRSRTMSHAPPLPRDTSVGSAVLVDAPSRSRTLERGRGRSVPRTTSSGSTYYVLPAKGQKVRVLHAEDDPAGLHATAPRTPQRKFLTRLFGGLSLGSRGDLDRQRAAEQQDAQDSGRRLVRRK